MGLKSPSKTDEALLASERPASTATNISNNRKDVLVTAGGRILEESGLKNPEASLRSAVKAISHKSSPSMTTMASPEAGFDAQAMADEAAFAARVKESNRLKAEEGAALAAAKLKAEDEKAAALAAAKLEAEKEAAAALAAAKLRAQEEAALSARMLKAKEEEAAILAAKKLRAEEEAFKAAAEKDAFEAAARSEKLKRRTVKFFEFFKP